MHKAWKDWLALNSIGVFTAVVVGLVAFVGVLMHYSPRVSTAISTLTVI